jgi:hypothetical protein
MEANGVDACAMTWVPQLQMGPRAPTSSAFNQESFRLGRRRMADNANRILKQESDCDETLNWKSLFHAQ